MSLAKQVDQLRTERNGHIDATLFRIRELLFLFPKDLNLPRQLEEIQSMRDQLMSRTDPNVIHLDEVKEFYAKKHFQRR